MKVVGFSFIRNAVKCDYPISEAIRSILPLCDEVIVAVGNSEDETLQLVRNIHPAKVRIIETEWDDTLRQGGRAFAVETDKAFQAIGADADWCFYIQADEIVHENTLDAVESTMKKNLQRTEVDGLLFDFIHFWGGYNYTAASHRWHKKEIRIIRNNKNIFSYKDSMGFRKKPNEKLNVLNSGGLIHHYSHVKPPELMMNKSIEMDKLWHSDEWVKEKYRSLDLSKYDYEGIDALQLFGGMHPSVMKDRIARMSWHFEYDTSRSKMKWKYRFRKWLEDEFGLSVGVYKNYRLLRS